MADRPQMTMAEHIKLGSYLTYAHRGLVREYGLIRRAAGEGSEATVLASSACTQLGDLRRALTALLRAEHPGISSEDAERVYNQRPPDYADTDEAQVVLDFFEAERSRQVPEDAQCYLALLYHPQSVQASVLGIFPDVQDARSVLQVQLDRIRASGTSQVWDGLVLPVWTNLMDLPPTSPPRLSVVEESTHG